MQTINVRQLRNTIPHLRETLEREHEIVLVSNGEPIARILPVTSPPPLQSMAWFRAKNPVQVTDSTQLVRADRDRRGT
ncbi:MAG: type II toxin-antitoxin system Phd/YefM family antitoxin [Polaromonas sp.]|nr:type II toxin-antitoxin system Phd/YefM family antitoxin [Polaromonas sp.]